MTTATSAVSKSAQGDLLTITYPSRVWLNNGTGLLSSSFQLLGNHATRALGLGDLDGDGDLDFVEGNYHSSGPQASRVWRNQ